MRFSTGEIGLATQRVSRDLQEFVMSQTISMASGFRSIGVRPAKNSTIGFSEGSFQLFKNPETTDRMRRYI